MGNSLLRNKWFWFGVAFCLLAALIQPILAVPFQPGNLFVAYGGSNIGVFKMDGTLVQTLSVSPSSFGTGTTLSGGGGVALDEFGNLYVTVSNFGGTADRRGIIKFNAAGVKVLEINSGITTDFRGLAVRNGVMYVARASGIQRFNAETGVSISPILSSGISFRDVTFDRQGNLYGLYISGGNVLVRKWTGVEPPITDILLGSEATHPDPRALVLDMDGNLYITVNTSPQRRVRKFSPDGTLLADYLAPRAISGAGNILIGLDYDPGTQRLFASHTGTGIGQILWIDKNASSGATMSAFGPANLSGVRWLAVYPTPEPTTAILLAAGLLLLRRRFRKR